MLYHCQLNYCYSRIIVKVEVISQYQWSQNLCACLFDSNPTSLAKLKIDYVSVEAKIYSILGLFI
jgi:hypothetical protein